MRRCHSSGTAAIVSHYYDFSMRLTTSFTKKFLFFDKGLGEWVRRTNKEGWAWFQMRIEPAFLYQNLIPDLQAW